MTDSKESSCSPERHSGLPSVTHHCILHAVEGLAPHGISEVLPRSGSHNITSFCKELASLVRNSSDKPPLLPQDELLPPITIQNFYSDVTTELEFAAAIEKALVDATTVSGVELEALHTICWDYYQESKKGEVSYPKWLSKSCTYRLWLVFNQCLDDGTQCRMATVTMNEILRRIIELCSYTWNDTYCVSGQKMNFTFPQFLECLTDYFERFSLDTSLTAEVISDLVDETVHGVLKKGFLEKKGHVRRNWRRRWFILKKTILTYYSTDKKAVKGELVLNAHTKVNTLPDKTNRRFMFIVTCGATEKELTISAVDQKMKQDWMLAIRKAIALARLAEDGESGRKELEDALSGFFLLKYGTNQPLLRRQDSDIRQMKHHTTKKKFRTIQKITKISENTTPTSPTRQGTEEEEEEEGEQDDYVHMRPGTEMFNSSSEEEEEDGYCHMERADFVSCSSSVPSGGQSTPSTDKDSILTFSLPLSGQTGLHDDVFTPNKTVSKQDVTKSLQTKQESNTGLEDSYYEECEVGGARYIPGQRYVDVRQPWAEKLDEDLSEKSLSPPKTTPTHTVASPSSPQHSYLTILPSPKATPPPEDLPSPVHSPLSPPIPPPRRGSSSQPRSRGPASPTRDVPPIPPPRSSTSTGLSPVTSPTHNPPSPSPVHYRKISVPLSPPGGPTANIEGSKEDVTSFMKKCRSSGEIDSNKPVPSSRLH